MLLHINQTFAVTTHKKEMMLHINQTFAVASHRTEMLLHISQTFAATTHKTDILVPIKRTVDVTTHKTEILCSPPREPQNLYRYQYHEHFFNYLIPTGILNSYCENFMQPTKQMELQCIQRSQALRCGDMGTTKPNIIKHEIK